MGCGKKEQGKKMLKKNKILGWLENLKELMNRMDLVFGVKKGLFLKKHRKVWIWKFNYKVENNLYR